VLVSVKAPGAAAYGPTGRFPKNRNRYWQLRGGNQYVGPVEVWSGTLNDGEEVAVSIQFLQDDDSGTAPASLGRAADAIAQNEDYSWLATPIRGVAAALGANRDDSLGTTGARMRNQGGTLVWSPATTTERPTTVDRDEMEMGDGRGLPVTHRTTFHRRNRWNYTMNVGVYTGGQRVAMGQLASR
jgi:hypothetical protein